MPTGRLVRLLPCAALALLLAAASPRGDEGDAPTVLRPGESLVLDLDAADQAPDGPERRRLLELHVEADGPVTLEARSVDGDPYVRVRGDDGRVVFADDDGGLLWNARLVVEARVAAPLVLDVGIKVGAGRLLVQARSGDVPLPEGEAGELALVEWLETRGRASIARGRDEGAYDLFEAARLVQARGLRGRARVLLQQALPAAERLLDARPAGDAGLRALRLLGWTNTQLAEQAVRAGDADDAESRLATARVVAEALDEGPMIAQARELLGQVRLLRHDLPGAEGLLREAISLGDAVGEARVSILARGHLAACLMDVGDLVEARALLDEAVAMAEELPDEAPNAEALRAEALVDLALHLERRGQLVESTSILRDVCARPLPESLRLRGLGSLAALDRRTGRFDEAYEAVEEALSIARRLGDEAAEADLLVVQAAVDRVANDLLASEEHLRAALALSGDDDSRLERRILLGHLLRRAGRTDELAELSATCLARARAADDPDLLARALELSMFEALERGDVDLAASFAEEHLRVVDESVLGSRAASAHLFVAHLERLRGHPERADGQLATSLELARRRPDATLRLEVLDEAMVVALAADDVARAQATLDEARVLLEGRIVDRDVLAGGLRRAAAPYAVWSAHAQDLVAVRMASATDARARESLAADGFVALGASQARTLLEGLAELDAGVRSPPITRARTQLERLRAAREAAEIALARTPQDEASRDARSVLEADVVRRHADEHEAALALDALLPDESRVRAETGFAWDVVAHAALGEHDLLVDFADGGEHLFAYVVARDAIAWRDLGPRAVIDELVAAFVAGTSRPDRLATPPEIVTLGRALRERLVDPWVEQLVTVAPDTDAGRLVIVPSASLAALSFEALVLDGPSRPENFSEVVFLGDRRQVVYAPSAPVLTRLAQQSRRAPSGPVLVLADPVYASERGDASGEEAVGRRGRPELQRLPGTRDEALSIARRVLTRGGGESPDLDALASGRSASLRDERVLLFLGEDASAARLRELDGPLAALHCATHGVVAGDDPRRSGLLLSGDVDDDGWLGTSDVLELVLDTDVAVLSACETGGGPVRAGDGVQSLARAFLFAGARSVVASLWQVDDRETQVLMDRFYAGWLDEGLSRADALLRARRELRHAEPRPGAFVGTGRGELLPGARAELERARPSLAGHPFFWASFVYIGPPGR